MIARGGGGGQDHQHRLGAQACRQPHDRRRTTAARGALFANCYGSQARSWSKHESRLLLECHRLPVIATGSTGPSTTIKFVASISSGAVGRLPKPRPIEAGSRCLLLPPGDYVNGQMIYVDGGLLGRDLNAAMTAAQPTISGSGGVSLAQRLRTFTPAILFGLRRGPPSPLPSMSPLRLSSASPPGRRPRRRWSASRCRGHRCANRCSE